MADSVLAAASYGVPAIVRVESSERIRIGRALDQGAAGVMVPRLPNLFSFSGPGSPSVLANMVLHAEVQVDWAVELMLAVGRGEHLFAEGGPGGDRLVVEAEQLVTGAKPGVVEVRIGRHDRHVEVGGLDARALEQRRPVRIRRERDDARLEHRHVGEPAERFVARTKKLQDILGEYQDAVVPEKRLRTLVAEDRRSPVALLANELVKRQRVRRQAAQLDFFEQWPKLERRGRKAWK